MSRRRQFAPIIALIVLILSVILLVALLPSTPDSASPSTNTDVAPTIEPTVVPQIDIGYHLARNELQAALYQLEVDAATNGWTSGLHRQAGNIWRNIGDETRALPHWEAAADLAPSTDLYRTLANTYIRSGEWGKAHDHIQRLLDLNPADTWGLYYGGALLAPSNPTTAREYLSQLVVAQDNYAESAKRLLAIMGDDDNDPLLSSRVGAMLASTQEWSLAENAFRHAAAINHPFPSAMAYVALMKVQRGANGEEWMLNAVSLAPQNPNVRFIEGVYWRAVGQFDKSEASLTFALRLSPENPVFMTELGNTYREMGNLNDAEYWLQVALNVSDADPQIADALERLYAEEAMLLPEEALAMLADNRSQPNNPNVLSANGWAEHLLGNSEDGLALIEQALSREPNNPRALYDKARILYETANYDEASIILRDLVADETPFAELASRLLAQIE